MTVSSETRQAGPFVGDDVTTVFPFEFKVFAASDVVVTIADSDGIETVQTLTTDYSVSLNANQNSDPGGDVTLVTALADGSTMVLSSAVPLTQETSLPNVGSFNPSTVTTALDKLTILAQQLQAAVDRAVKLPITSTDSSDSFYQLLTSMASSSGTTVTFNTYADVVTTGWVEPRFVVVLADETNGGFRTTYFYDGVALNWVPLVGA